MSAEKIKIVYVLTSCKQVGPVQQTLNIISHLDRERFEPVLLTLYPEPGDGSSQLEKFKAVCGHVFVPLSKGKILLGALGGLKKALRELAPQVVHTHGVFPDFAVCRAGGAPQLITLRNFVWDDYPARYGKLLGAVLARLQLWTVRRAEKAVTCSESLSGLYREKLGLELDFVRNGVETSRYTRPEPGEKEALRRELRLPQEAFLYVYAAPVIARKNQRFLLETFSASLRDSGIALLLLGDGADLPALREEFGGLKNVDFRGNVGDVPRYLKACDAYVSVSRSEGMPNGVLEAMAAALPVVLSDIPQHREIFSAGGEIGYLYERENAASLAEAMKRLAAGEAGAMGDRACACARERFDAGRCCRAYEEIYCRLAERKEPERS